MVHHINKSYFLNRIAEYGLSQRDANNHGLGVDSQGNILINVRDFNGNYFGYVPSKYKDRVKKINARKTFGGDAEESYLVPLQSKRLHPDTIKRWKENNPNAKVPKYLIPKKEESGFPAMPMPNNYLILEKGFVDHLVITEGYFKAIALSQEYVPAVAFDGVLNFQLKGGLGTFLKNSKIKKITLLYDADVNGIRMDGGVFSNRRENTFKLSIQRFMRQVHNFNKRNGKKISVTVCIPKLGEHKGIDDLLNNAECSSERHEIVTELVSGIGNQHFTFYKIGSTTVDREIGKIFGANYQEWYNRHKKEIGNQPFKYNGTKYQFMQPDIHGDNLFESDSQSYIRLVENPFSFSIPEEKQKVFPITAYMSEKSAELDLVISENKLIAIDSPTGSGKTSFFCGNKKLLGKTDSYFKRNPNQLGVLVVPLVSIAKQIASEYRIPAIYGNTRIMDGKRHQFVVCTYDCIHHIKDLEDRILIIDEAHKLVDDYGNAKTKQLFRADTMRNLMECMEVAQKTILLSGTMPIDLVYAHKFFYVQFKRKKSNNIHLFQANTHKRNNDEFLKTTLQFIENKSVENKLDIVFWNHKEMLLEIKRHLVKSGKYQDSDVAIISRKDIDSGNNKVYNNIISHQKIEGAKLILTTCIIGEGINIRNGNIGNLYIINNKCTNTFLQFIARFRNMELLNVYDVRGPENDVAKEFKYSSQGIIEHLQATLNLQKDYIQFNIDDFPWELDEDEKEYAEQIYDSDYHYVSRHVSPHIYIKNKIAKIDLLSVLNTEKQRKMETMNNAFYFSEILQYDYIHYKGIARIENPVEIDLQKVDKASIESQLKAELIRNPESVISGLQHYYMESKNKHGVADLQRLAPDLVEGGSGFYDSNKQMMEYKWYRKWIRIYAFLHSLKMVPVKIEEYIASISASNFDADVSKWKYLMGIITYENRHYRKQMNILHKGDAKVFIRFKKLVESMAKEGTINGIDLARKTNTMFQNRLKLDKGEEPPRMTYWNKNTVHKLITTFFECEVIHYSGYDEYIVHGEAHNPFAQSMEGMNPKYFLEYLQS